MKKLANTYKIKLYIKNISNQHVIIYLFGLKEKKIVLFMKIYGKFTYYFWSKNNLKA